jgi:hypothetical protein
MNKRTIFVFGSNTEGIHGAGAAREAVEKWGAIYGQASGLQGDSYAIITTQLFAPSKYPLPLIKINIQAFLEFAEKMKQSNPEIEFYVTPVGTGLAGYTREEILPLFDNAPSNCNLTWKDKNNRKAQQ